MGKVRYKPQRYSAFREASPKTMYEFCMAAPSISTARNGTSRYPVTANFAASMSRRSSAVVRLWMDSSVMDEYFDNAVSELSLSSRTASLIVQYQTMNRNANRIAITVVKMPSRKHRSLGCIMLPAMPPEDAEEAVSTSAISSS